MVQGRQVQGLRIADPRVLAPGSTASDLDRLLPGQEILGIRRRGKLLILDLVTCRLGIRFGMTGRLLVDGQSPIDRLLWSSPRTEPRWLRAELVFAGGGTLGLLDPRRLGRLVLDPPEEDLGPDALDARPQDLERIWVGSASLKAALLDQRRVAGIGNLVADEVLWRAGLAPLRPASGLDAEERSRLHRTVQLTLRDLLDRGGSHRGDLMPERHPGGRCPKEGTGLRRDRVGGRTTWWCPGHQR